MNAATLPTLPCLERAHLALVTSSLADALRAAVYTANDADAPTIPAPHVHEDARALVAAVRAGDTLAARFELAVLLASRGKSDDAMTAGKAGRAFDFRIEGDLVTYRIVRHPGSSWLTHRTMVRAVDLQTSEDYVLENAPRRLGLEDVRALAAKAPTKGAPLTPERFARGAEAALEYARALAEGPEVWSERDVAIGWVAFMAAGGLKPGWSGFPSHVVQALEAAYGEGLAEVDDLHACARRIDDMARALWVALADAETEGGVVSIAPKGGA